MALQQSQAIVLIENRLNSIQNEYDKRQGNAEALLLSQLKAANRHRLITALVATLSLLSLGWQAALHFGVVH
ncbi:TPA: hypothetical protein ACYX8S_005068 [Klebsiella pneumoniae]|uniref:hypothetical protein n=1 Tax=Klebsiella pneumoniae TaxID=573 RepID=UPI001157E226|nr:hypothetical protein [Klebsiella pneumoniae]MCQ3960345.1 hypothetical protein [Klebsiella pneumoniae]MDD1119235.1 hypothetical protein [Klebsiella pneumoniae]HBR4790650.1 hypothetical protein [Klebsiella pneumoniae]HDT4415362.1 hypothetical protein [Klebsiella pneumoniae subsp. pneumoniae]